MLFATPMAESAVAAYLTELAAKTEPRGVKVGSYPRWGHKMNTVTLVGRDLSFMQEIAPEIEKNVQGVRVEKEEDADPPDDEDLES